MRNATKNVNLIYFETLLYSFKIRNKNNKKKLIAENEQKTDPK